MYQIPGNSRNILEFLAAAWSYRVLKNNSTSISQEKFTGYGREFKGIEQTKYKSVPIFFYS